MTLDDDYYGNDVSPEVPSNVCPFILGLPATVMPTLKEKTGGHTSESSLTKARKFKSHLPIPAKPPLAPKALTVHLDKSFDGRLSAVGEISPSQ